MGLVFLGFVGAFRGFFLWGLISLGGGVNTRALWRSFFKKKTCVMDF
jgi:hypothetical protein